MKNRPLLERIGFALSGITSAWRSEASFRTQIVIAVGVVFVLLWLRPTAVWWALVLLTICLVLAAELFNTALERVIDHLHPEHHPAIKIAKDCAAGAVMVLSLAALAVFVALIINSWNGL